MQPQRRAAANPFALMMDPQAVIEAVERSGCLEHLKRRVCRPLDKPLIPKRPSDDLHAYDLAIDEDDSYSALDELADGAVVDAMHEGGLDVHE